MKISFGCITNHLARLSMALAQSEITGQVHVISNPESATKGLNEILGRMEAEGADIGILTHHDMSYRRVWLPQVRQQLAKLPDSWIAAGIIGKDVKGRICGRFHDTRIPMVFDTYDIHEFPHPACCFDECCILVNLHKEFRFDEALDGFDLYGTLCVLQAQEMGGTAWIIDSGVASVKVATPAGEVVVDFSFAQHHCTRPFDWFPDKVFCERFKWLHDRFPNAARIDTTVLGVPDGLDEKAA
jgi:hypothetical protein